VRTRQSAAATRAARHGVRGRGSLEAADSNDLVLGADSDGEGVRSAAQDGVGAVVERLKGYRVCGGCEGTVDPGRAKTSSPGTKTVSGPSRGGAEEGEGEETSGSENETCWRVWKRLAKSEGLLGTRPKKNKNWKPL
jgi:hypothetical protein